MPTYSIKIPGAGDFEVDSPTPLTDYQAYQYALQSQLGNAPRKIGAEALPDTIRAEAESRVPGEKLIIGAGRALSETGHGIRQLVQQGLQAARERWGDAQPAQPSPATSQQSEQYAQPSQMPFSDDAQLANERAMEAGLGGFGTVGRIGGEVGQAVAMGVPKAIAATSNAIRKGVSMLPQAARAALIPRGVAAAAPVAASAGVGAGIEAARPILGDETRAGNAAFGAVAGAGGEALAAGLARALRGFTPSEEAAWLMARGVQPTIGQALPQNTLGRAINKAEQTASSWSVFGDPVGAARKRAAKEYIGQVVNDVRPPGQFNEPIDATGWKAVRDIDNEYRQAYDAVLGKVRGVDINKTPFLQQAINIVDDPAYGLVKQQKRQVLNVIENIIDRKPMTGSQLKDVESDLARMAREWQSSASAQERALGRVMDKLEESFVQSRATQMPPGAQDALDAIDKQYAKFARVKSASASPGAMAESGEFTPHQLLTAIRQSEPSKRGRFARGESLMQEDAAAAARVLKNYLPDSGTAPRLIGSMVATGGAHMLGILPQLLALRAAQTVYGAKPVQKFALGGYDWQKSGAAGRALRSNTGRALAQALARTAKPESASQAKRRANAPPAR